MKNEERDDLLLDMRRSLDRLESYVLAIDRKVNGLEDYVKAIANSLLSPSEIVAIESDIAKAATVKADREAARVDTSSSTARVGMEPE